MRRSLCPSEGVFVQLLYSQLRFTLVPDGHDLHLVVLQIDSVDQAVPPFDELAQAASRTGSYGRPKFGCVASVAARSNRRSMTCVATVGRSPAIRSRIALSLSRARSAQTTSSGTYPNRLRSFCRASSFPVTRPAATSASPECTSRSSSSSSTRL